MAAIEVIKEVLSKIEEARTRSKMTVDVVFGPIRFVAGADPTLSGMDVMFYPCPTTDEYRFRKPRGHHVETIEQFDVFLQSAIKEFAIES